MRKPDVLEPDEVRPRDKGEEAPPKRRMPTRPFRLGMKVLGVISLGFRVIGWVVDAFG